MSIDEQSERQRELERYETIVEALGDPVYAVDADGCYTFGNDAFVEETGSPEEEIIGEHVSRILPEEDIEEVKRVIRELLVGEGGEFRGTAGVIRDITERQERKQELDVLKERGELELDLHEFEEELPEGGPPMLPTTGPIYHIAFEVPDYRALVGTREALEERDHPIYRGPGRHGPGNNFFLYFPDPDGYPLERGLVSPSPGTSGTTARNCSRLFSFSICVVPKRLPLIVTVVAVSFDRPYSHVRRYIL